MLDFIEINKLSKLHDGDKFFFSKTDLIIDTFKIIENINHDVVLITGNSDYPIIDDIVSRCPSNVIRWFAQNNKTDSNRVIAIPIGLMNYEHSSRGEEHGLGWFEKSQAPFISKFIDKSKTITPNKLIYANFTISTNYNLRTAIKNIVDVIDYIDWVEPNNSLGYVKEFYNPFYEKILEYECVLCPDGNGIDSHRFYETLYLNRIPITFNSEYYYKLHHHFPCILITDIEMLKNQNYIEGEIKRVKNMEWDKSKLTNKFWENKILESI
jgi:hypothetical protein